MSKKVKVFILTCTNCGARADGNTRAADNWTIAPKVICPDCNGCGGSPTYQIPAKEKGKVIHIPFGGTR